MSARGAAVIGAGASGTFAALHLLREGAARVTMIERERVPGRGIAYGTRRPEHLLNVNARRMSVWPDDPEQFARWYAARGGDAEDFAPRQLFGDYVCELMSSVADRIEIVTGDAVDVVRTGGGERVDLADGRSVDADAVILALGNYRPALLPGLDPAALGRLYVADPWHGGFADGLGPDDTVFVLGTALTAVDTALTLDAEGFRGNILAISRRGLVPRAHLRREPVVEPPEALPETLVGLMRQVRARGRRIGWREAIHELRHVTQHFWGELPLVERRRFVRHLRAWWDVHRHRIAPAVAERIRQMQDEGRLRFAAGKLVSAEPDGDKARVTWRPRGHDDVETLRVRRIVNGSGPELDIARAGEPLLDALLAAGRIRPDNVRLGIDVDPACRTIGADGDPCDTLFAIGPVTRGTFWESIAIGDIAIQAQRIARRITA